MTERQKPEMGPQKRSIKLTPALGDWTTFKPPRVMMKRIKSGLYGFDRLSKEELEQAHIIHYQFGERLFDALRKDLGIRGEIYKVDAFQNNYANFIKTFSENSLFAKIIIDQFHEEVFFSLDLDLANSLINALLGGGESTPINRSLTDAENTIVQTALSEYINIYNDVFSNLLGQLRINFESGDELFPASNIGTSSSFVYFIIETQLNNTYGKITLGYSGKLIKSILKILNEHKPAEAIKITRLPEPVLSAAPHALKVILGNTEINSSDIYSLEAGDVISLNQSIYSALQAQLGEKKILLCQPGTKDGKRAIKIVSVEKDYLAGKEVKVAPPSVDKIEAELPEAEAAPAAEAPEEEPESVEAAAPEEEFEEEYPEEDYTEEDEEFEEEEAPEEYEEDFEEEAEEEDEDLGEEDVLGEDEIEEDFEDKP